MTVSRSMRHFKRNPCGVCGGGDDMPRSQGRRCTGFTSTDGWVHCSREEYAGSIQPGPETPPLYAHRPAGPCKCGQEHAPMAIEDTWYLKDHTFVCAYDYRNAGGVVVMQVGRFVDREGEKTFRQRWPDGAGRWLYKMPEGFQRILYRLPQLSAADFDAPVVIVEGEKDADAGARAGLLTTTMPGGADKWRYVEDSARDVLGGRSVVIIADKDKLSDVDVKRGHTVAQGMRHARAVEASLRGHVRSIRVIEVPGTGKDLADYLAAGGDAKALVAPPERRRIELEDEDEDEDDTTPDAAVTKAHAGHKTPRTREPGEDDVDDEIAAAGDWVPWAAETPRAPAGLRDEVAAAAKRAATTRPWGELKPFDRVDLPEFPVATLSHWQSEWAAATADAVQVPVDLPSMLALASASLACSRGIRVEVREGWSVPTNLWCVSAALPGERKSEVFRAATLPVFAYQATLAAQAAPKVAAYESQKRVLEGKKARAEKSAMEGKSIGGIPAHMAVEQIIQELAELPPVFAPRLLADDTTSEAAAQILSEGGERLGIFSAEGGLFDGMAGRYSDQKSNLDVWLKGHDGDPLIVNRISRPALILKQPLVSVAVCTQPEVIRGLASHDGFRGRGLLARFMYSIPTSLVGERKIGRPPVPAGTRAAYGHAMTALLHGIAQKPRRLKLNAAAAKAALDFETETEARLRPDGDLRPIVDWASKMVALVARIAGVLHCGDHADVVHLDADPLAETGMPDEIPLQTWLRARAIGDYALAHARHAFVLMDNDPTIVLAEKLLTWASRKQLSSFSVRDALTYNNVTREEVEKALEELEARGYVRPAPPPPPRPGKPPSPIFDVRPM